MDKCTHRIWGAGTSSYACKNIATLERNGRPVCFRHSVEGLKQHQKERLDASIKAMQERVDSECYNAAAGELAKFRGLTEGDIERQLCELRGEILY